MRAACSVRVASPGASLARRAGAPSMAEGNGTIAPFLQDRWIYFLADYALVLPWGKICSGAWGRSDLA